jgi:hypothetical protein
MNEASNSRDLQRVYEFRVFDGTALEGLPVYLVTIHFTQAARQLMAERRRDVLSEARKIAKGLVFSLGEPIQGRMEMRDFLRTSTRWDHQPATLIVPVLRLG